MGVELTVQVPPAQAVGWEGVMQRLAARGLSLQMRMIDGLPAFPDEQPPDDWRELRVGTTAGMVTIRRIPAGVGLAVWGNADAALRHDWHLLAWAIANATGGNVQTDAGDSEEFQKNTKTS